jgi:hypothetical protein
VGKIQDNQLQGGNADRQKVISEEISPKLQNLNVLSLIFF